MVDLLPENLYLEMCDVLQSRYQTCDTSSAFVDCCINRIEYYSKMYRMSIDQSNLNYPVLHVVLTASEKFVLHMPLLNHNSHIIVLVSF